ncbi:hypothetical protein ACQKCH_15105 [Nubsella zeaxanthinifaciens]|jgi:CRP-like cAMP-binding protein|uniref:hypothetical protein n=1 Tax=Nubsella zeaxanthinifaciens TaxID=392412 RepID=UPI003CFDD2F7
MEFKKKNISELLSLLREWIPITAEFEKALYRCMELQLVRAKKELTILSKDIHYAWFSVDCWIAEYRTLASGKEEVYTIYGPKQIFTDINSFLTETASNHKFMIISGERLLSIERSNFQYLRKFSETALLLEHYMLQQWELDRWHSELMTYSDYEKVSHFAKKYPINDLPAKVSSSFLRMTPSRFSGARLLFNKNK